MAATNAPVEKKISYQEERGKPMPSFNHSIVQANLILEFAHFSQYRICSELTVELEGLKHIPDISVYPHAPADFRHDHPTRQDAPILAVEILSATQSEQEIVDKAEVYLRNGVKSCWIVSPPLRTITILWPGGEQEVFHRGLAKDPATGVTADLARVFV